MMKYTIFVFYTSCLQNFLLTKSRCRIFPYF